MGENDGLCAGKKEIVFGKTTFQDDLTERERESLYVIRHYRVEKASD
jgi:hypothetical protein